MNTNTKNNTNSSSTSRPVPHGKRLTKNTNVLSWDCGTSNLCYCLLEYIGTDEQEFRVVMWENFSLNAIDLKQAVNALVNKLNRCPWMIEADYVCIESQIMRNTDMKVISHVIQTYFETRGTRLSSTMVMRDDDGMLADTPRVSIRHGPAVSFVASRSKFTVCKVPEPKGIKTRRIRNKKVAVLMAQKLLKDQGDLTSLNYINQFKKKDDLADSLVQGIYFLRVLQKRKDHAKRIAIHLGLDDTPAKGSKIIDLNEGCEDNEVPLPQVYKNDTFTMPVYDIQNANIESSSCYNRTTKDSKWDQPLSN